MRQKYLCSVLSALGRDRTQSLGELKCTLEVLFPMEIHRTEVYTITWPSRLVGSTPHPPERCLCAERSLKLYKANGGFR